MMESLFVAIPCKHVFCPLQVAYVDSIHSRLIYLALSTEEVERVAGFFSSFVVFVSLFDALVEGIRSINNIQIIEKWIYNIIDYFLHQSHGDRIHDSIHFDPLQAKKKIRSVLL